jgi:MFS family permease
LVRYLEEMKSPSPLGNSLFRRFFAAQVLALLGMGLTTVALILLVYELDPLQAGWILGAALGLKMAIKIVVAPIAGAYGTHVPRRIFLTGINLSRALMVGLFPFVDQTWQVFVTVGLIAVSEGAFNPVFQATVPDILKDEGTYTKALSLNRIAFELENLLSPLLAAFFLGFVSFEFLFEMNAVAFVLSALLLLSCRLPDREIIDEVIAPFAKVTRGLRLYFANRELMGVFALYFAIATASATAIVATVLYVKGILLLDDAFVAYAMAGFGAGSILAALILPGLLDKVSDLRVMGGGAFIIFLALLAGTSAPGLFLFVVIWSLMGFGAGLAMTPVGRVITRASSPDQRTEVFAAQYALSHVSWLVLYPLVGALAGMFSLPVAFGILCLIALAGLVSAHFIWRG